MRYLPSGPFLGAVRLVNTLQTAQYLCYGSFTFTCRTTACFSYVIQQYDSILHVVYHQPLRFFGCWGFEVNNYSFYLKKGIIL